MAFELDQSDEAARPFVQHPYGGASGGLAQQQVAFPMARELPGIGFRRPLMNQVLDPRPIGPWRPLAGLAFMSQTTQDIALELGMPLGTVKSHQRRAFLRLQGEMVDAP